ncbi:lambda exonuclease family protein [Litorivivens sp.]|uniref:lambda exonuclease family protein n=1 Tax=Litorivivens sp. TaxID=2020868 RepID=UPI003564E853
MITLETEVIHVEQGTDEWLAERAGLFSGSNFHLCMERLKSGKNKGGWTSAAESEANKLAFERACGGVLDDTGFQGAHARRGNALEPEAREEHAKAIDILEIEQCGIIRTVDRKFGVSVDGLIDDDGGSEYKCFTEASKVYEVLTASETDMVTAQVQGGMLLSGRKWWHFGLYHPALKAIGRSINIIEIERDDEYIEELWENMRLFDALIEEKKQAILGSVQQPLKYPAAPIFAAQPAIKF